MLLPWASQNPEGAGGQSPRPPRLHHRQPRGLTEAPRLPRAHVSSLVSRSVKPFSQQTYTVQPSLPLPGGWAGSDSLLCHTLRLLSRSQVPTAGRSRPLRRHPGARSDCAPRLLAAPRSSPEPRPLCAQGCPSSQERLRAGSVQFKGHGGCPGQLLHLHMHPIQSGSWAGLPLGHCNPLQDRVPAEPGVPAWSPRSAEGRLLRRGRLGGTLAAHVTSFVLASFSGGSLHLPLCRARWDPRPWPPFLVWD